MWSRTKKLLAGSGLAAALLASGAAHANLVTNGGFETGDFNGWSTTLDALYDGVDVIAPHDGTYAAFFGGANSSISQNLATVAGANYVLSFWLMVESDVTGVAASNSFGLDFGGATVMSMTDAAASGYTRYDVAFVASGASTNLTFNFSQGPAFFDLDSVNVTLPEPGSIALLAAAGLGGFLASRRRKPASTTA